MKIKTAIAAAMPVRIMVIILGPPNISEPTPAIKLPKGDTAMLRLTTAVTRPRKLSGIES